MTYIPMGQQGGFISRLLSGAGTPDIQFDGDVITLDPPKSLIAETLDRFRGQIETLDGRDMRLTKVIDDSTEERRQVRACREAVRMAMELLENPAQPTVSSDLWNGDGGQKPVLADEPMFGQEFPSGVKGKQDWTDND